jgi:hypothetical protein
MKKLHASSYEAQLAPEELRDLHRHLTAPGTSLLQTQQNAPPWRNGPLAGTKPSLGTLSKIASRLRAESHLLDMEATEKTLRAIVQKLQKNPNCPSELIDQLCGLAGHDYIRSYINHEPAGDRVALFRLLLKREEQRLAHPKNDDALASLLLKFSQLPKP